MHLFLRDERGIVTGWFVRVFLGLAVAGLILFDAAALVINYFGLDTAADDIAVAISTEIDSLPNSANFQCDVKNDTAGAPLFCRDAHMLSREHKATLLEASVDQDSVVKIRLRRVADTVVVERLGFLKKYGVARAQGQSGTT
jgi:hypothetical protein